MKKLLLSFAIGLCTIWQANAKTDVAISSCGTFNAVTSTDMLGVNLGILSGATGSSASQGFMSSCNGLVTGITLYSAVPVSPTAGVITVDFYVGSFNSCGASDTVALIADGLTIIVTPVATASGTVYAVNIPFSSSLSISASTQYGIGLSHSSVVTLTNLPLVLRSGYTFPLYLNCVPSGTLAFKLEGTFPDVETCTLSSPEISGVATICSGNTTSLTASATGTTGSTTYTWSGPSSFTANTATISGISAAGTYTCIIANSVTCTTSVSQVLTVTASPEVTTSGASRCGSGTVTLGATTTSGTLSWFTTSSGGTSIATGGSFTTPSISTTTTYYVSASNGSCTSSRLAATATVKAIPSVTSTTPGTTCASSSAVLGATASVGTLKWYTASTGGTSIGTGTTFTTPILSFNQFFFVQADNNGCLSPTRTSVLATANPIPSVSSVTSAVRCGSGAGFLLASSAAVNMNWYSTSTGGTSVGTGKAFFPNVSSSTTFYAEAESFFGCKSPRVATAVIINSCTSNLSISSLNTSNICKSNGVIVVTGTGFTFGIKARLGGVQVPVVVVSPTQVRVYSNGAGMSGDLALYYLSGEAVVQSGITVNTGCRSGALEEESEAMNVYPNPVVDNMNIELSGLLENSSVTVSDMMGKVIYSNTSSNSLVVPMAEQPAGIYVVHVKSGTTVVTRSIVKE